MVCSRILDKKQVLKVEWLSHQFPKHLLSVMAYFHNRTNLKKLGRTKTTLQISIYFHFYVVLIGKNYVTTGGKHDDFIFELKSRFFACYENQSQSLRVSFILPFFRLHHLR